MSNDQSDFEQLTGGADSEGRSQDTGSEQLGSGDSQQQQSSQEQQKPTDIVEELRRIENYFTLSTTFWTDEWLGAKTSDELIKDLDDLRTKETRFLKYFWEAFFRLSDPTVTEQATKNRKEIEGKAEVLIERVKSHITIAKEREKTSAQDKRDEEERKRNLKAAQSQAVQWDENKKKNEELENAKRELANTKTDRDQQLSDLTQKLTTETKKLQNASKEARDFEEKWTSSANARKICDQETERLSKEKTALQQKIGSMIEEDTQEDEEYSQEIKEHKQKLANLKEKHDHAQSTLTKKNQELALQTESSRELEEKIDIERKEKAKLEAEIIYLEREADIDQEYFDFQLNLHQSLIQDLKQTARRHPRDVEQSDEPIAAAQTMEVSNSILIEELLSVAHRLMAVDKMSTEISLKDVPRTELLRRKEYISNLAGEYDNKYDNLDKKKLSETKKTSTSNNRVEFIAYAKTLTERVDKYINIDDQRSNDQTPSDSNNQPEEPIKNQNTAPIISIPETKPVSLNYKLDVVELQTFSGNLTEWNAWREMFVVLVHDNKNIPTLMKLHLLRSHLKGLPLETVIGYQLTAENYNAAWEDLQMRYNRKDNIIHEYIKKFIEVPILNAHSPYQKIFTVINGTKQMIQALPGLGVVVTHWDPFILFVLLSKLDEETRRAWKNHIGRKENATVGELLEFLETKAIENQPSMADKMYNLLSGKKAACLPGTSQKTPQQQRIFYTEGASGSQEKPPGKTKSNTTLRKCPKCSGNHQLSWCGEYKRMSFSDRKKFIEIKKLCFRCLEPHFFRDCTKKDCPICGRAHHSTICPQKEQNPQKTFKPKN